MWVSLQDREFVDAGLNHGSGQFCEPPLPIIMSATLPLILRNSALLADGAELFAGLTSDDIADPFNDNLAGSHADVVAGDLSREMSAGSGLEMVR